MLFHIIIGKQVTTLFHILSFFLMGKFSLSDKVKGLVIVRYKMCPERTMSDVIKSNYKGAALSNNSEEWVKLKKKMQI